MWLDTSLPLSQYAFFPRVAGSELGTIAKHAIELGSQLVQTSNLKIANPGNATSYDVDVLNPSYDRGDRGFQKVRLFKSRPESLFGGNLILRKKPAPPFLEAISFIRASASYFPELRYASHEWLGFEYIEGVTGKSLVKKMSGSPDLIANVATMGAEILFHLAQDGLGFFDVEFHAGHNVILNVSGALKLFDWDAQEKMTGFSPVEILLRWLEKNLYQGLYDSNSKLSFEQRADLYLAMTKRLLELCPDVATVNDPTQLVYSLQYGSRYNEAQNAFRIGSSTRQLREIEVDGIKLYQESDASKRKVDPLFISSLMLGRDAFVQYAQVHRNDVSNTLNFFI